jgi:hypothetical protein
MTTAFPRLIVLTLFAVAASSSLAQTANQGAGTANAGANQQRNDTQGVGRENRFLGGPGAYQDPYQSQMNSFGAQEDALMNTQTDPTRTPTETRMNDQAAAGRTPGSFVQPGTTAMRRKALTRDASGKLVATPDSASQNLYRQSFGAPAKDAATQVYRSPW